MGVPALRKGAHEGCPYSGARQTHGSGDEEGFKAALAGPNERRSPTPSGLRGIGPQPLSVGYHPRLFKSNPFGVSASFHLRTEIQVCGS